MITQREGVFGVHERCISMHNSSVIYITVNDFEWEHPIISLLLSSGVVSTYSLDAK